jgi:hypothetical protein
LSARARSRAAVAIAASPARKNSVQAACEEAVAGSFDDATPMLGDFGIAEFTANRTERRQRALFVLAHQP